MADIETNSALSPTNTKLTAETEGQSEGELVKDRPGATENGHVYDRVRITRYNDSHQLANYLRNRYKPSRASRCRDEQANHDSPCTMARECCRADRLIEALQESGADNAFFLLVTHYGSDGSNRVRLVGLGQRNAGDRLQLSSQYLSPPRGRECPEGWLDKSIQPNQTIFDVVKEGLQSVTGTARPSSENMTPMHWGLDLLLADMQGVVEAFADDPAGSHILYKLNLDDISFSEKGLRVLQTVMTTLSGGSQSALPVQ